MPNFGCRMEMTQLVSYLYVFIFVLSNIQAKSNNRIYWNVTTTRITKGQPLTLTCYVERTLQCPNEYPRIWSRGSQDNFTTLLMNGKVQDESNTSGANKYTENIVKDCETFSLIIANLSESDFNEEYGCQYGFDIYRKMLTVQDVNYEYRWNDLLTKTITTIEENHLEILLIIKKIYPLPECLPNFKEIDLNHSTFQQNNTRNGLAFSVELKVSTTLNSTLSTRSLEFECRYGNYVYTIKPTIYNSTICNPDYDLPWYYIVTFFIYIVIPSYGVVFGAFVGFVFIFNIGYLQIGRQLKRLKFLILFLTAAISSVVVYKSGVHCQTGKECQQNVLYIMELVLKLEATVIGIFITIGIAATLYETDFNKVFQPWSKKDIKLWLEIITSTFLSLMMFGYIVMLSNMHTYQPSFYISTYAPVSYLYWMCSLFTGLGEAAATLEMIEKCNNAVNIYLRADEEIAFIKKRDTSPGQTQDELVFEQELHTSAEIEQKESPLINLEEGSTLIKRMTSKSNIKKIDSLGHDIVTKTFQECGEEEYTDAFTLLNQRNPEEDLIHIQPQTDKVIGPRSGDQEDECTSLLHFGTNNYDDTDIDLATEFNQTSSILDTGSEESQTYSGDLMLHYEPDVDGIQSHAYVLFHESFHDDDKEK